jgi:hypothetical protein
LCTRRDCRHGDCDRARFSDAGSILLAVALAFLFGYTLTSLPLLRAGLAPREVTPIALASDTASITLMEAVDNAIILAIPGAIDAMLGDTLFWVRSRSRS